MNEYVEWLKGLEDDDTPEQDAKVAAKEKKKAGTPTATCTTKRANNANI